MKPHMVLILAATLILGAGLYAAFSTPKDGSGVLALVAPLLASAACAFLAWRSSRPRIVLSPPLRTPIITLSIIAACMCVLASIAVVSAISAQPPPNSSASEPGATVTIPNYDNTGATVSYTVTRNPPADADPTHRVFAFAFSAGVLILTAITLAFLRASDNDQPADASPAPAGS